jgi:hypothetical protein
MLVLVLVMVRVGVSEGNPLLVRVGEVVITGVWVLGIKLGSLVSNGKAVSDQ